MTCWNLHVLINISRAEYADEYIRMMVCLFATTSTCSILCMWILAPRHYKTKQ